MFSMFLPISSSDVLFCLQYSDLMKKRKIVLNDKAKIQAVIDELDKKKNEALLKAWEQVNKVGTTVISVFSLQNWMFFFLINKILWGMKKKKKKNKQTNKQTKEKK